MRIGELAGLTGASERSLRHYEKAGLLQVGRGRNGYRDYDDDAVGEVRKIRALLSVGFSTKTIKIMLPCVDENAQGFDLCDEIVEILERHVRESAAELERLRERRRQLEGFLAAGGHRSHPADMRPR